MSDNQLNTSRDQLLQDFNRVVADTEALLASMANVTGEKAAALRASVEENLRTAKASLREIQGATTERARAAARVSDEYVHENPWVAIGIAAAVGLIVGLAINGRK